MRAPGRTRGFTLVEVVIATTILTVVMAIAFDATQRSMQHAKHGATLVGLRTKARSVHARIVRELQQTSQRRVYQPDSPGASSFANEVPVAANVKLASFRYRLCTGYLDAGSIPSPNPDRLEPGDPRYEASPRGWRWDAATRRLFFVLPGGDELLALESVSDFALVMDLAGAMTVTLALEVPDPDGRARGAKIKVFEEAQMTTPMNPR